MNSYTTVRAMLMSCPPFAASFVYCTCIAFVSAARRDCAPCRSDPDDRVCGGPRLDALRRVLDAARPVCVERVWRAQAVDCDGAPGCVHNCAGLTSAWLFDQKTEKPRFTRGMATLLAHSVLAIVLALPRVAAPAARARPARQLRACAAQRRHDARTWATRIPSTSWNCRYPPTARAGGAHRGRRPTSCTWPCAARQTPSLPRRAPCASQCRAAPP